LAVELTMELAMQKQAITSRYLATEWWFHWFVSWQDSHTAWVLDLRTRKFVCGFFCHRGSWERLCPGELQDLLTDLEGNLLKDLDDGTIDFDEGDLYLTDTLPSWAFIHPSRQLRFPFIESHGHNADKAQPT